MGRPKKEAEPVQEEKPVMESIQEEKKPKQKVDKSTQLLKEISGLENDLAAKKAEYSKYIADQRKEVEAPSLADCIKLSRRDDLNSDRRELKKVTALALDKLKKSK